MKINLNIIVFMGLCLLIPVLIIRSFALIPATKHVLFYMHSNDTLSKQLNDTASANVIPASPSVQLASFITGDSSLIVKQETDADGLRLTVEGSYVRICEWLGRMPDGALISCYVEHDALKNCERAEVVMYAQ